MLRLFTLSLVLIVSLVAIAGAQTPAPLGVQVKLSLAENKTVYRIGEPIKLVMEFTADREGYLVEFLPDDKQPGSDTVIISPDTGFTRWIDELNDNRAYPRHVFSTDKLTRSPKRVEITINDRVRFDNPGRYTVSVTTRRVWAVSTAKEQQEQFLLSTNSITFEVQPMSDDDEAKEVKRLSESLAVKRDPETEEVIPNQLSYLTGDPSTREKVRRFLSPEERGGNYHTHIWYGLFIARNRALVLKLLESGLRDPNIPATLQILNATTRIKTLLVHGVREKPVDAIKAMLDPAEDPRAAEIRDAYVVELAAGLAKRTGNSQTITAVTVLSSAPKDSQAASAGAREARRILVQQFDTLHPYTQHGLLQQHWDAMRDVALIPSLKKMLAGSGRDAKFQREAALPRLIELAPDEARVYVIAEIRDAGSLVDPKILYALKDEALPEVDAALLEQIRRLTALTQNRDQVYLKLKTSLLVRFATDSIYQELMELYRAVGAKLPVESRAGLLAYFAKHNGREAMPLIEEAVAELKPDEDPRILREITSLYYSDTIGVLLKKILETHDVSQASQAAYLIGTHGAAGDELVLEARLNRWREEWRDRVAEADAQHQGRIERGIIYALINGKSWKLAPERAQALQTSCLTKLCKQSNLVRQ